MEVEMVEPDLFLRLSDEATDRLAEAVLDRVPPGQARHDGRPKS